MSIHNVSGRSPAFFATKRVEVPNSAPVNPIRLYVEHEYAGTYRLRATNGVRDWTVGKGKKQHMLQARANLIALNPVGKYTIG